MEARTIKIDGMGCDHCVKAVKGALLGVPGLSVVSVEIGSAVVEVEDDAVYAKALEAIVEEGFTVV